MTAAGHEPCGAPPRSNLEATQPGLRVPRRTRAMLLIMLLATGLFAYFCREPILAGLGTYLDVGEPLRERVDAVYVLGGGLETRPFVAAAAYRHGLARMILLPSPKHPGASEHLIDRGETELTEALLLRLGVAGEAIVRLKQPVDSTQGEAAALAEYLRQHPLERVAVVTNDFHTRRARLIFGRAVRDVGVEVRYVSAPTDGFSGSDWWHQESGVETYVLEWVKLVGHGLFSQ